jgi:hypothetical protein
MRQLAQGGKNRGVQLILQEVEMCELFLPPKIATRLPA